MIEKATFGAGCFWHIQDVFSELNGVTKTEVGYMGGDEENYPNPTYEQVSSDKTGHIEVVQLQFNPKIIPYEQLLKTFWEIHNPTSLNKQGLDKGTQYKSIIFYHTEEQKQQALVSKQQHQKPLNKPIVTLIKPAKTFHKAEEYHQFYNKKRGASCGI